MNEMNETVVNSIVSSIEQSGEVENIKKTLKKRLVDSGWEEQVKMECMRLIRSKGTDRINLHHLQKEVTPYAREKIPDEVKKELLGKIKDAIFREYENIETSEKSLK